MINSSRSKECVFFCWPVISVVACSKYLERFSPSSKWEKAFASFESVTEFKNEWKVAAEHICMQMEENS